MPDWDMLHAWAYGVGVLLALNAAVTVATVVHVTSQGVSLLWLAAAPAAFVVAWCAPRRKVTLGASMAIAAAVLAVLANGVAVGSPGDAIGVSGHLGIGVLVLIFGAIPAVIGGTAGYWLSPKNVVRHRG